MSMTVPGNRFTDVSTSTVGAKNQLGQVVWTKGKAYRYVEAAEALAVRRLVSLDATEDDGYTVGYPAATSDKAVVGVTLAAIASGGFGWIQCHGLASVDFDGAGADSAANVPVQAYDTIGKCEGIDVTVATEIGGAVGIALDASTTDVALDVFLRGLM